MKCANKTRFREWADRKCYTNASLAKLLTRMSGFVTTAQNVYTWRTGTCQPKPKYWPYVETLTDGAVPASKWKPRKKPKGSGR